MHGCVGKGVFCGSAMARGATSDVLYSAVLARRAVDTGTAVAVGVAVDLVVAPVVPAHAASKALLPTEIIT